MAKRRAAEFRKGTPRWKLQRALDERFENAEDFFRLVADEATIGQVSASSTFYGFLAGRRSLPKAQRAIYLRELGVTDQLLDQVDALRHIDTPKRRDRLEALEKDLAEVARIQALILDELALAVDDKGRLASPPSQTPARRKTRGKGR